MAGSTDKLIQDIERAFADVEHPGDDDLTGSSYGEEPDALVRDFRGRHDWRVLEPAFLDQAPEGWATALSFFSDRALHFYLPAYLIADLRGELSSATPAWRLCWGVTAQEETKRIARVWGGGTVGDRARRGFALFSREQVDAVVGYLLWRVDAHGYEDITIVQALEHYWLPRQT